MCSRPVADCVHCHICRKNCSFLSKYGIDIGDTERLRELAYHCFLCGRCSAVCPLGIDGRQTVLELRRERAASDERTDIEVKYKGLIGEKKNYKFSNWKHVTSGSVFFPGCNFPSMYPKTNSKLEKLFASHGIGTVYECCGKPVAELGLKQDEDEIICKICKRLEDNHVNEIVTACPNCRDFFGDRLGIKVVSVYAKLSELGAGNVINGDAEFYLPCPDRTERRWIEEIRPFINGKIVCTDGAQCCGLGGSAMTYEKEIADRFVRKLEESCGSHTYTYCASCTGRFRRSGFKTIDHILPLILGTNEQPDTKKSYINRVLTKIK